MIKLLQTSTTQDTPIDKQTLFGVVCSNTDKEILSVIRVRWEGVDEYILNLVAFLNDLDSIDDEKLLVQKCVDTGVIYWNKLNKESCSDAHRVAAFIKGTLLYLPEVLRWRVIWPEITRAPSVQWDPYEKTLTKTWEELGREADRIKRENGLSTLNGVESHHFRSIILTKHLIDDPRLMASIVGDFSYILGE